MDHLDKYIGSARDAEPFVRFHNSDSLGVTWRDFSVLMFPHIKSGPMVTGYWAEPNGCRSIACSMQNDCEALPSRRCCVVV